MQASDIPVKLQLPFANSAGPAYRRVVPVNSQIGIQNGAASYTTGFVPLNFVPVGSGGVPPFGEDFNGVLFDLSSWVRWVGAGVTNPWDAAFSSAVGGYPKGALVLNAAGTGFWLSTVENNTSNPDAAGAGWQAVVFIASSATPLVDGSGSAGTAVEYARGDHRHPTDTSRLAASYLSSNTGKVAGVVAPGTVVPGHVPKFNDNQGTIADGFPTTESAGTIVLTAGTHTPGHLVVAFDANGSLIPGPAISSGDPTVAAVHGATVAGNLAAFNDTTGTVADSGFSPAALMSANDALKYQMHVVF